MAEQVTDTGVQDTGVTAGAEQDNLLQPNVGEQQTQTASPTEGQPSGDNEPAQEAKQDADLLDVKALETEIEKTENTAPEKYEDFKLPADFVLEGEDKGMVYDSFKELGLSQKKAQALIDLHCKFLQRQNAAINQENARQASAWKTQVRSRPGYEEERALVTQGMRAIIKTQEEAALFRDSPLANHPAMWSLMVKVGRLVGEDSLGKGNGAVAQDSDKFHVNLATL